MSGMYGHFSVFEYGDGTHDIAIGVKEIAAFMDRTRMVPINSHSGLYIAVAECRPLRREIKGGWQPWDGQVVAQSNNDTTAADIAPYREIVAAIFDAAFPTPEILADEFIRPHWGQHGDDEEWLRASAKMLDAKYRPERAALDAKYWQERAALTAKYREQVIALFLEHPNQYWASRRIKHEKTTALMNG